MQNFPQQLQMQLSRKPKGFYGFFIAFLKRASSLEHFEKKMSLLAEVFPKLLTPKGVDMQMSKRPYFRTRFRKQDFSRFETLLKSARHYYYRMFRLILDRLSWKESVLVRCEVLGLLGNILTAKYKYSRRNMQIFPQILQTQLSQKRKSFSGFFIMFLKCTSSLRHFGVRILA